MPLRAVPRIDELSRSPSSACPRHEGRARRPRERLPFRDTASRSPRCGPANCKAGKPASPAVRARGVRALARLLAAALVLLVTARAGAEPAGKLLRIDPRTSQQAGDPIITTVIEMSQHNRVSDAIMGCATLTGNRRLSCMSEALEKPNALYTPLPFPEKYALLTVEVDGMPHPATFVSKAKWGESSREPGVGTAWLILVDADKRMGSSFRAARRLAGRFVAAMGPGDIVNLMFFNDRQVVRDSKWLAASQKSKAARLIDSMTATFPSQGRNRALLTLIKSAATDAFRSLGNVGSSVQVPMHQAMVVLSSGFGGTDPSTSGPGALQLQQYMSAGRFPPENTALPKTPVPVISIYFPHSTYDEFRNNSLDFMQNLANPSIGGFFSVMQKGEEERSDALVQAVRSRFSRMFIVKWRVSCIAPQLTQTFALAFRKVNPPIAGDTTFKNVPLGIDPTDWPLDVDEAQTQASIGEGLYPGGRFRVFGNFCWGGDDSRAEAYFVPAGSAPPSDLDAADIQAARRAQKQLIAQGMQARAVRASDAFVEFEAPDSAKIIHGSGPRAVSRLIVYDNRAARTSGVTADAILQLRARPAPFPLLWVLTGLLGLTVVALAAVLLVRSRRPATAAGPAAPGVLATAASTATLATLTGSAGVFTVPTGSTVCAGRDSERCAILLSEQHISGLHASFELRKGKLFVRDEASNNGTQVEGRAAEPGKWVEVPHGGQVKLGPVEFSVQLS